MKSNILLLSKNQYLIAGIKALLKGVDLRLFERDEMEFFVHMCSSSLNQRMLIIYDSEDEVVVKNLFEDFSDCLLCSEQLKKDPFYVAGSINLPSLSFSSINIKKSRVHEIIILHYYISMHYTYDDISKKIGMEKRRISYILTNYIRSKNINNKNIFYLSNLDDGADRKIA